MERSADVIKRSNKRSAHMMDLIRQSELLIKHMRENGMLPEEG
jgi:hypothetical protein